MQSTHSFMVNGDIQILAQRAHFKTNSNSTVIVPGKYIVWDHKLQPESMVSYISWLYSKLYNTVYQFNTVYVSVSVLPNIKF